MSLDDNGTGMVSALKLLSGGVYTLFFLFFLT